jgi:hypothetical protein
MNCERCSTVSGEMAGFRVRSEILDLKVCLACAVQAQALNLRVESLPAPNPQKKPPIAA